MRSLRQVPLMAGLLAAVVLGTLSAPAQEQTEQDSGRRGFRDRERTRQFDPSQMRSMMLERIKEQLEATDEEWNVMKPLVEDVMAKQMDARGGMFRGMGPRRQAGEGRRFGPEPSQEAEALRAALDSKESSSEVLKSKLKAFRSAQKKDEQELNAAREKLRQVLSLRQEARLVLMGFLD